MSRRVRCSGRVRLNQPKMDLEGVHHALPKTDRCNRGGGAGDANRRRSAADDMKYPDWKGKWERFVVRGLPGQPSHDQTKPWGRGQQAPLTPEYQAVLEASIADQANGGLGNF